MNRTSGTARLDDRGRLVLPADFRRQLGLRAGDEVRMNVEGDGVLRVESRRAAAHALIGLAGSSPQSATDLLREDRRLQAAAEEADARRFAQKASTPSSSLGATR
ncbi:MAG: AbrB/MazE/SpoVT family DNA-binding domain-containing protein [Solirubrobacteraceae bacterium]|jgi:AbrB family looped-hinge helix DNA binding protein